MGGEVRFWLLRKGEGGGGNLLAQLEELLPVGDGPVEPGHAAREDGVAEEEEAGEEGGGFDKDVRGEEEGSSNGEGENDCHKAHSVDVGGEERDRGERADKLLAFLLLLTATRGKR